jgi:hypothetical protein
MDEWELLVRTFLFLAENAASVLWFLCFFVFCREE